MARILDLALGFIAICWNLGVQAQGNSACAQWCAANFAHPGYYCTSLAARGTGPCYECGPGNPAPTKMICNEVCVDTTTDLNNCGSCGNVCGSNQFCNAGVCTASYPTCSSPFRCGQGPPTLCTAPNAPPNTLCFCVDGPSRPEGLCIDASKTGSCADLGPSCSSDSECGEDNLCFTNCCGSRCTSVSSRCQYGPPAGAPAKMLRLKRDEIDDFLATSSTFNATVAELES